MANLLTIATAKAVLLAVVFAIMRPPATEFARQAIAGIVAGAAFGFAFFALFYLWVPAIAFEAEVTLAFIAVNAIASYGLTGATVALIPVDLPHRGKAAIAARDRAYFAGLATASMAAFLISDNDFVRAFAIGAGLMAIAEAAALLAGRRGPVSRMLHGELAPMLTVLAASAGLGVFYEALNLAFPVWHWTTLDAVAPPLRIGLMMAIGYIVLIHPLFIAVRLVRR